MLRRLLKRYRKDQYVTDEVSETDTRNDLSDFKTLPDWDVEDQFSKYLLLKNLWL